MFDCKGPAVFIAMGNLTSGVFDPIEITSPMDVDQRFAYTQHILRGVVHKKYKVVML